MDKLKKLYLQLIQEFTPHTNYIIDYLIQDSCKWFSDMNIITSKDSFVVEKKINTSYLEHQLKIELSKFENNILIEDILSEIEKNTKYNFPCEWFIVSNGTISSNRNNYVIHFIIRNIELNDYKKLYTKESFEQSFMELLGFMTNSELEYEKYYPLHGFIGEVECMDFNGLSIKKATISDCNFFNIYYNFDYPGTMCETDLEIGDYFLILKRKCLKRDSMIEYTEDSKEAVARVELLLLLAGNGNIRLGRGINKYLDWTMYATHPTNAKGDPMGFNQNKFPYCIDESFRKQVEDHKWILTDELKLCKPLHYALEWLNKSKQETDINNKIVNLSISLEYSIRTSSGSVTRDLKNKSEILYSYDGLNNPKKAEKAIKKFYKLRGTIVHGNKDAVLTTNTIYIIDHAETIIRENLMLLCKLNQSHTFNKICDYVDEGLNPLQLNLKYIIDTNEK